MRIPAFAIFMVLTIWAAAPAEAQTYNPRFPVCHQYYDIGGPTIECSYDTLEQCQASASGRGGSCFNNPYFGVRRR